MVTDQEAQDIRAAAVQETIAKVAELTGVNPKRVTTVEELASRLSPLKVPEPTDEVLVRMSRQLADKWLDSFKPTLTSVIREVLAELVYRGDHADQEDAAD